MFRVVPQLMVDDVSRSVGFYANVLGFVVSVEDPEGTPEFVSLEREDAALFLVSAASREEPLPVDASGTTQRGAGVRLFFEVDDAAALYEQVRGSGVQIVRDLTFNEEEDYTEFLMADPDGYQIGIYS